MPDFCLDPRLAADSCLLAELPLCQLRLIDDARYLWLVLIPRRAGVSEVFELSVEDQHQMWREAAMIGRAVKADQAGDKLNIASLGNMVPQLHIHVIVRHRGDAAWPGPVWGQGKPSPTTPGTSPRFASVCCRSSAACLFPIDPDCLSAALHLLQHLPGVVSHKLV